MILYRPVGSAELRLIEESGYRAFPPRLAGQPIFYPVLNEAHACEIAGGWNTKEGGGKGYVTRFEIDDGCAARFEVHTVGSRKHQELWVPAEKLEIFSRHLIGEIQVIKESAGGGT